MEKLTFTQVIWKTYQKMMVEIEKKRPELAKTVKEKVVNEYMLLAGIENFLMPRFDIPKKTLTLTGSDVMQILSTQFGKKEEDLWITFIDTEYQQVYKYLNYMCKVCSQIPQNK